MESQYNFGNISNTSIAFGYNDFGELLQFQSREVNRSDLGGFSFDFGTIFNKKINNALELMVAASYTPEASIASKNQSEFSTIVIDSDETEFIVDS